MEDSDGTLVLAWGPPKGGTALTVRLAREHQKPCLRVDLKHGGDAAGVKEWGKINRIRVLNVAGPREGESPGIHACALAFLRQVLKNP